MAAEHDAIVAQFREMAQGCRDVACAEAHVKRYTDQLNGALEQQRVHREYLDCVIRPVIALFEKRAEELRGDDE